MRIFSGFALLSVTAFCLAAQATDAAKRKPADSGAPSEEAKPAGTRAAISGAVKDENGGSINSGTVTISCTATRLILALADGKYEASNLDPGLCDITVEAPGFTSVEEKGIVLDAAHPVLRDFRMSPSADPIVVPEARIMPVASILIAMGLYLLSILVTRWYKIAKPSRNFLLSQIDSLRNSLEANRRPENSDRVSHLQEQLLRIRAGYERPRHLFLQVLFWSQSVENASWISVHQMERELAAYLSPPEAIDTGLMTAAEQLKELGKPTATRIATAIDSELKAQHSDRSMRRQLLAEARSMIYNRSDANYVSLMDWQNKAMWLILVSCLLLMLLAAAAGNPVLFVAGAAGGLLSRLMRTLKGTGVPVDYGASWTTLFLSPLFGAFCGWFGIGLIVLLANPQVGLLGKLFLPVTWSETLKLSTLTIAFVLGFSERLFDSLIAAVENQAIMGGSNPPPTTQAAQQADNAGSSGASGAAPATPYDQIRQKIGQAIATGNADDKDKVLTFLSDMGQDADHGATADQLKALVAKVEAFVGSDADKQQRYITEAVRAGFASS